MSVYAEYLALVGQIRLMIKPGGRKPLPVEVAKCRPDPESLGFFCCLLRTLLDPLQYNSLRVSRTTLGVGSWFVSGNSHEPCMGLRNAAMGGYNLSNAKMLKDKNSVRAVG